MSVAQKTAVPNVIQIRGNIRLITANAVMGVLIVMTSPVSTMAMDLKISQNIAPLISTLLVSQYILQRIHFSVFPSLFLSNLLLFPSPDSRTYQQQGAME
jgi:type III secretory pathway component EscV